MSLIVYFYPSYRTVPDSKHSEAVREGSELPPEFLTCTWHRLELGKGSFCRKRQAAPPPECMA